MLVREMIAMGYILIIDKCSGSEKYWTGKDYLYQGNKYPVFSNNVSEAKVYKYERTAKNAVVNIRQWYGVDCVVQKV